MAAIVGTHMGHLSDEARAVRRDKNARNANRIRGKNAPAIGRGSNRWATRLWLKGNALARGTRGHK